MPEALNYRPSHSAVYYKPPTNFRFGPTVLSTIGAAVLVAIASGAYGLFQSDISSPIARVGIVAVMAVVIGGCAAFAVRAGHVRSKLLAAFLGAGLGMLSLYVMWLAWLHHALFRFKTPVDLWRLILSPIAMFRLIQFINRFGTWRYRDQSYSGPILAIIWIIEGGAILGTSVMLGIKGSANPETIDCSECRSRLVRQRPMPRFSIARQEDLVASIEAHDFAELLAHDRPTHEDEPEIVLALWSCPRCGDTNVLSANRLAYERNSQGKYALVIRPLVSQMLITREEATEVRALKGKQVGEGEPAQHEDADDVATGDAPNDAADDALNREPQAKEGHATDGDPL